MYNHTVSYSATYCLITVTHCCSTYSQTTVIFTVSVTVTLQSPITVQPTVIYSHTRVSHSSTAVNYSAIYSQVTVILQLPIVKQLQSQQQYS